MTIQKQNRILAEYLLKEIRTFLFEEKSISEEVNEMAWQIRNLLIDAIHGSILPSDYSRGRIEKTGILPYRYCGIEIDIEWRFSNQPANDKTIQSSSYASFNPKTKVLRITVNAVDWRYDEGKMVESIQHELTHAFENFKRKSVPYKNLGRYQIAYNYLKSNPPTDIIKNEAQAIAIIIYISYNFEQRAFYNGAYRKLMHRGEEFWHDFSNAIQETQFFQWQIMLTKAYLYLYKKGETMTVIDALKDYGLGYLQILKIAKTARKNLKRMMARLIQKVKSDYAKSHDGDGPIQIPTPTEAKERKHILTEINRRYFCR